MLSLQIYLVPPSFPRRPYGVHLTLSGTQVFRLRVRVSRGLNDLLLPQDAESCYLVHSLLKFYLNTVFKNYPSKVAKFKISKSFSTLANNFFVIVSKLQPSVSRS